jgi:hypothetical protein
LLPNMIDEVNSLILLKLVFNFYCWSWFFIAEVDSLIFNLLKLIFANAKIFSWLFVNMKVERLLIEDTNTVMNNECVCSFTEFIYLFCCKMVPIR